MLANECIFCGNALINEIFIPLTNNENERKKWEIQK